MNVKITSDGSPMGTKVLAEDGTDISGRVSEITWRHRAGEIPQAEVLLGLVALQIDGWARLVSCDGREVRRIEYENGDVEEFPGRLPEQNGELTLTSVDGRTRKISANP